ncbi:1-deoxy-D-xylulose-5-phosphate reductoisomerase [Candidatus Acidulodesulfobacterium sp. H_13]|uniref:1-deoxy-D-xylulose-5-phosphate reductoisomerase n=1 Tax=Candidatus Acidulodesulfobacterium sp. H_13 TaxID=3395470 RepID=UPI003AF91297
MRKIFLAGSTGSIGKNAVEVAFSYPNKLKITGIAAGHFGAELKGQVIRLKPSYCVLSSRAESDKAKSTLENMVGIETKFLFGEEGLREAIFHGDFDIVLNAISGSAGLMPSYWSLKAGKDLALANKESMVMAGEILNRTAESSKAKIIPVDSEHSALFQCLNCGKKSDVNKLILTASGGPFYGRDKASFKEITPAMALNHPKWKMGKKITVDSSTLANKGLEIIEAYFLFGIDEKYIDVLIHPQAVIHSMVEFKDGSIIAQMGQPDMKGPIGYALSYPRRFHSLMKPLMLADIAFIEFFKPDAEKFPFLRLARQALRIGKSMPAVFCEANEFFVNSFLNERISFNGIAENVEKVMEKYNPSELNDIEDVIAAKRQAAILSRAV